jgi:hypothetical protein
MLGALWTDEVVVIDEQSLKLHYYQLGLHSPLEYYQYCPNQNARIWSHCLHVGSCAQLLIAASCLVFGFNENGDWNFTEVMWPATWCLPISSNILGDEFTWGIKLNALISKVPRFFLIFYDTKRKERTKQARPSLPIIFIFYYVLFNSLSDHFKELYSLAKKAVVAHSSIVFCICYNRHERNSCFKRFKLNFKFIIIRVFVWCSLYLGTGKYLQLPSIIRRSKKAVFGFIKDKIRKKINS